MFLVPYWQDWKLQKYIFKIDINVFANIIIDINVFVYVIFAILDLGDGVKRISEPTDAGSLVAHCDTATRLWDHRL